MPLKEQERRTLQEYFQAGIKRCTERIEKMSKTSWGLMSAGAQEMTAVGMLSWFRKDKEQHYAVSFTSISEMPLDVFMLFSESSAKAVTRVVTKPYGERMRKLKDLVPLTIGEVSNVIAQGIVGVLADAMTQSIILSIPKVEKGPKVDLLADSFDTYDGRKDALLLSQVEIFSDSLMSQCSILVILDRENVHKNLKALFI